MIYLTIKFTLDSTVLKLNGLKNTVSDYLKGHTDTLHILLVYKNLNLHKFNTFFFLVSPQIYFLSLSLKNAWGLASGVSASSVSEYVSDSPVFILLCSLNGWHQKFFVMNCQMRSMCGLCSLLLSLLLSSLILLLKSHFNYLLLLHGTIRSDVYSFVVILWELTTEKIPWDTLNPMQVQF